SEDMMMKLTDMGANMASFLSTAMTAYSIYAATMIMVQIIWKCEKKEFMMNAKRKLKSCVYVGSYCKEKVPWWSAPVLPGVGGVVCIEEREAYCCFNSPLSRIVQEQVRPQLGMNFGSAKNPQCGGIPFERLAEIDWSQVDLSEWLGILQQNGMFPDPAKLNLDTLTGSGRDFNIDGHRQDVGDRT